MHGFSPLTVLRCADNDKIILVDTTQCLTIMEMTDWPIYSSKRVKVQTGAFMDDILLFAEENRCGMFEVPAPGRIKIVGVSAVGAHGIPVL